MAVDRRGFIKRVALLMGAVAGPWSLAGRKGNAAGQVAPALSFLTPSEYKYINRMALDVVPDGPVVSGEVDVAGNIDRFFAEENLSPDFIVMMRYLRLIRLADPVIPLIRRVAPATYEDLLSFKRTICFLGYYSDANGEAGLAPERRVVWPRIGYGGPKGDDWWPPAEEQQLDRSLLVDRIEARS